MKTEIRQPQQERSIEKKNKIIRAGYELFSEVGYYGTNTVEIAKRAGVSTGIVYGYFSDKRDVLLCVLDIYMEEITEPIFKLFQALKQPLDIKKLAQEVLSVTIDLHGTHSQLHNTLHSLSATDEAVAKRFLDLENTITKGLTSLLTDLGLKKANLPERIHLAINLVQSFSHEFVFDKHDYLDYDQMREIVTNTIVALFE